MATIYEQVLADRFDELDPVLSRFLASDRGRATGRMTVTRNAGRARNLAASALGIPPAGDYDLVLEVVPRGSGQHWIRRFNRRFNQHVLTTRQRRAQDLLVELSGPGGLGFELIVESGALLFQARKAWMLGIRVPLWLAPGIDAENRGSGAGGWKVRVRFRVPLLGAIAQYEGEVVPEWL